MKNMIKTLLIVAGLFSSAIHIANATHLMGGSLAYEYLGINGAGLYEYRVSITIYRYCASGSTTLPTNLDIGVYQDAAGNPTGDKELLITGNLPLITITPITPPNANDTCTFTPNVCVEEGYYEAVLVIPANTSGYYFHSDACCRNNNIINLNNPGGTGQSYYAYAPPPTTVNSSPTFAVAPVPFLCSSDTVSILNQAFDPDGDLLVYHFVVPHDGVFGPGTGQPNPPVTYPNPIQTVTFAPTYSVMDPFGPGGYAVIDTATGLASYYAPNQGFYVLAIEIEEYRNGVLIGITRRDLQIIVIACPVNPAPVLSGSTQVSYTINEGDNLCFDVEFSDPNGDSLYITHTGDIFNPLLTVPTATFNDTSGTGNVVSQFCWTTSCDQGQTVPYQFSVSATDNGCPAKITNIVYTINVVNTPAPDSIVGPDTVCFSASTGIQYTVPVSTGNTHGWIVTNGTINGSQTGTTIDVNFTAPGPATISAYTVNPNGCESDTIVKNVYVVPIPSAVAGPDQQFCNGDSTSIGTGSTPGYTYSWSPATGLSSTTASNPTVILSNGGATPVTVTYILTVSLNGCINTDTVDVTVNPIPVAAAGPDVFFCSGDSTTIGSAAIPGITYLWTPATGLSSNSVSDPVVTIISGSGINDTLQFILQVESSAGCIDTDTVLVIVEPVPIAQAGNDLTICGGESDTLGAALVPGYSYSWSPSTGLSSSTSSNPTVTLINSSGVPDTIVYILTATLGNCTDVDSVVVITEPSPVSNAGPDQLVCDGTTVELGTGTTPGYTYSWSPATGLSGANISDPILTLPPVGSTPDTLVFVVTTTLGTCVTSDTVTIISGPAPVANAGPNRNFCSGNTVNLGAANVPGYTYSWSPVTGLSNSGISNPTLTLTNLTTVNDTIFYIVTTTLFGCIDSDTTRVIVRPRPVSDAGPNQQLLCAGDSIQLGTAVTPGYTYSWSPITGLSDSTISDPILILNNTGSVPDTLYYVVTTTLNGCTSTDTTQVISAPQAVADAGTDALFCSGDSATIGNIAQPGYVYSWNPATGLSSATSPNPVITLINASGVNDTLYYVITADLFGCTANDTVMVIVQPLPLSEAGANTTICGGDTLVLGTVSTPGYTYNWTPVSGLSDPAISNPSVILLNNDTLPNTIVYTVTTTWNGCISSDSIVITVNPQPVVTASANPQSICLGTSATLNGSGAATYNWALLTAPGVSIGTGSSITVSPATNTSYILTGTNGFSCTNQDTVTVTVNPLPIVTIASVPDSVCLGDTLVLIATGATTFNWTNSAGTSLGTGSVLTTIPSATGTYTYIVTGTDSNLCVNSDSVIVTVNPAATLNAISGNISVCPGVLGVMYYVLNPNPTSTYQWTVTNGTISSGQGNDTIFVDWSSTPGTGIVSVIEITDLGCASPVPVTLNVSVNVLLIPTAPTGPTNFCANEAVGITYNCLNTPGSTYNWTAIGGIIVSGNGSATVVVDWTTPGPATVYLYYDETSTTATDTCFGTSDTLAVTINPSPNISAITGNNNVCIGASGNLSVPANTGSTYAWFVNGANLTGGNGTNSITVDYPVAGTAVIQVVETNSYGCVGDTATLNVTVNGLPAANAGPDTGVCIGQSVQLNASGGTTYSWSPATGLNNTQIQNPLASPATSTTYSVLVTDVNGCQNSDSVLVTVNPLPVISIIPASSVCIGSSIQLSASGGNTFLWSPAGSLDNPNIANPNASPVVNTTYTVIVTDGNGCVDSATVDITVNALPVAQAGPDTLICEGTSVMLSASGGTGFSWSPASSLNNPNTANPIATPSTSTIYTVTVTDANGCTDEDDMTVNLNDVPEASFTVDLNVISANCDGIMTNLINTSQNATSYLWLFPDGTTSTNENTTYHFNFNSTNITLIAYNNFCPDTSTQNFTGNLLDIIFNEISNVFTPNGDGLNDCFVLGSQYDFAACSAMKIFDRWGSEVYTASSSQPCWNGRKNNNGEELPAGTYFLTVAIAGHHYNGTVTLIR